MGIGSIPTRDSVLKESKNFSALGAGHSNQQRWAELELPFAVFLLGARLALTRQPKSENIKQIPEIIEYWTRLGVSRNDGGYYLLFVKEACLFDFTLAVTVIVEIVNLNIVSRVPETSECINIVIGQGNGEECNPPRYLWGHFPFLYRACHGPRHARPSLLGKDLQLQS